MKKLPKDAQIEHRRQALLLKWVKMHETPQNGLSGWVGGGQIDWVANKIHPRGLSRGLFDFVSSAQPEADERLLSTLSYAGRVFHGHIRGRAVFVGALDEAARDLDVICPVVRIGTDAYRYEFDKILSLNDWSIKAWGSRKHADEFRRRISFNLSQGEPVPPNVMQFAANLVAGDLDMPPAEKHQPPQRHRDALIVTTVNRVKAATGQRKTWGTYSNAKDMVDVGDPNPESIALTCGAALAGWGVNVSPKVVNQIVQEKQELSDIFDEIEWVLSPSVETLLLGQHDAASPMKAILNALMPQFNIERAIEYLLQPNTLKL